VVGWVFVVAMSLSYSVGALIRSVWLSTAVECGRFRPEATYFNALAPILDFCFGTFFDLNFRSAEGALHRARTHATCGTGHTL
jgi:hypothetical protein